MTREGKGETGRGEIVEKCKQAHAATLIGSRWPLRAAACSRKLVAATSTSV